MIKIVSFVHRNPEFTREQFVEYWKTVHAPLCKKLLVGLRRYVGSFPTGDRAPGKEPPYDALVELYFDDVASMEAALNGPLFQTDERRASSIKFMDVERSENLILEEIIVPV